MKYQKKKDFLLLATKVIKKIGMLVMLKNTINHFWETKTQNWWNDLIVTQQSKTIENPNITDIKSVSIEHPKTSRKFSKIIRQTKKVSQVGCAGKNSTSPLYDETTKSKSFWWRKDYRKYENNERISCL